MKRFPCLIATAFLALAAPVAAFADDAHHKTGVATTAGVVKKVDRDQAKITIQHGRLEHLDMPAMTMVFRVKGPEMLDHVKAGDSVRFAADKINGAYTVTQIEAAN